jgi:predicted phosphodiesterase
LRSPLRINIPLFILSDLHANGPAIRSVAESIPDSATVVFVGDAVGYYDDPNYACDYLRDRAAIAIAGNHDLYVTGKLPYELVRECKYRIQWTREKLTARNLKWLEELPLQHIFDPEEPFQLVVGEEIVEFTSLMLAHGSPGNCEQYIYPDTPIDFECENGTLAVFGHTHHPMFRRTAFGAVINPGSIGQPRDRIPSSSYATINFLSRAVNYLRIPYDHIGYAETLHKNGFDEESIRLLTRTK